MKKNISINLFGTLYNIDEDAYELLDRYMESVKHYFNREGGEDITDDIEHRIAELLWERREQGQQAIDVQTIRDIISKIGSPSDIDDGTVAHDSHAQTGGPDYSAAFADGGRQGGQSRESGTRQGEQKSTSWMDEQGARLRGHFRERRLYRDPNGKVLGGICSGFAQYMGGSDPLPWRILMILLFLFTRLSVGIVYLVLWLLVPAAHTPEERLRMKGIPITPENLNQEILRQSEPVQEENSRKVWIAILVILVILSFFVPILIGSWFAHYGLRFISSLMNLSIL